MTVTMKVMVRVIMKFMLMIQVMVMIAVMTMMTMMILMMINVMTKTGDGDDGVGNTATTRCSSRIKHGIQCLQCITVFDLHKLLGLDISTSSYKQES